MKTFKGLLTSLPDNGVFVFFSSMLGDHVNGKVSRIALEFGAIPGKAYHTMGNSFGFCIKQLTKDKMEKKFVLAQVDILYRIAKHRDCDKEFYVMYNGAYDVGQYTPNELVEVFKSKPIPKNIVFEENFAAMFNPKRIKEDEV